MYLRSIFITGFFSFTLLSCAPENPKAYLQPIASKNLVQSGSEVFDPKVDILFVVDNSQSMNRHQGNLAENIHKFTSTFINNSIVDYQIGVITTDMFATTLSGTPCCGKLVGKVKVVSNSTPRGNEILSSNLRVGVDGDYTEKVFDPVYAALSPPNITKDNLGFYRPEASLVLIFLTDAEDQSKNMTASDLYKFLVDLKMGNKKKVLAYGAIIPSGIEDGCIRDVKNSIPYKIEDFLRLVFNNKDNVMNICDPDYGTRLATMAMDIVNQVGSTIYLSAVPDLDSLRVTYGDLELPHDAEKGWFFNLKKNAVMLGKKIDWNSQPSGSRVRVFYKVTTYPSN